MYIMYIIYCLFIIIDIIIITIIICLYSFLLVANVYRLLDRKNLQ